MIYNWNNFFLFFPSVFLFEKFSNNKICSFIPDEFNLLNFSVKSSAILTIISFLPACILMMTCFTRIIIVLSLLRTALGVPYSPPNQILIGLSLFLTFFIMSPTLNKIYNTALIPLYKHEINTEVALKKIIKPIHIFMLKQTRKSDISVFWKLAKISFPMKKDNIPFYILLPSFIISELKTAFQIGFTVLLPFLIIDLVIASILMSLGIMMISPSTISLPLKLILFVLSDGWKLLVVSLAKSFFI
ncbi:flagellar type III secretion system pore protein FliP [Buchnera aphidicola]|uniref:Flagellar biosynthetic protein FliP n=1 Tax=Buchnera aphidicola subsp. Cinara cedri (strain Cc) TaxID=372461 RepID=Q058C2_BUCCC|nr:flagellar type III secretion system pore protein FliP [Buchnera aphidicola]ABJ90527.1 type III protein export, membrane component [Buchnera aphidicola BCc]